MAIEAQKIVTVKSLPGQVLQELPDTDTRSADDFQIFSGTSGKKYEDIGGRTIHTTIAAIRAMGANGIPDANPNIQYLTKDFGCPGTWVVDEEDTTSADNTGTVLVTAGGKRLKRNIDNEIILKWFGDQSNDPHSTIMDRALTALKDGSVLNTTGCVLDNLQSQITITDFKNLEIKGNGLFKRTSAGSAASTIMRISRCDGLKISGITIDGAQIQGRGVDMDYCKNSNVQISIKNIGDATYSSSYGLSIGVECHNSVIHGCNIYNIVSGGSTTGVRVSNFRDSTKYSVGVKIYGNVIDTIIPHDNGDGIVIDQQGYYSNCNIYDNHFISNHKSAIKLISGGCIVHDNTVDATNLTIESMFAGIRTTRGGNKIYNNVVQSYGSCSFEKGINLAGDDNECYGNSIVMGSNTGSFDGINVGATDGVNIKNIKIKDNKVTGGRNGITLDATLTSIDDIEITGNKLNANSNMINISPNVTNFKISSNFSTKEYSAYALNFAPSERLQNGQISNNYTIKNTNSLSQTAFHRSVELRGNISKGYGVIDEQQNGNKIIYADSTPASGNFLVGDKVINKSPQSGPIEWICVADGTPGTWMPFGSATVRSITASDAQKLSDDLVIIEATSSDVTFTLLAASQKKPVQIKNKTTSTKTVTIKGDGTTNIDDSNTYTLPSGSAIKIASDGTQYYITSLYNY